MNAMRKNGPLAELLSGLHRESDEEILGKARSLFVAVTRSFPGSSKSMEPWLPKRRENS